MANHPFKLGSTLHAHTNDVKAVIAMSNDLIVSASRDMSVRSWKRESSNEFTPDKEFLGHGHFVNSVAVIKPNQEHPEGLIVSGGSNKVIHVYQPNDQEPCYTLIGHTENVAALAVTPSGYIVSGSWDKTVIVWKHFQKAYTLEGHSAAVWAVLAIEDDLILTASADKSIRLWKNGKQQHIYQGHTDAVRGLALVPNIGFVSCSNDGTLRVWTLDGQTVQQLDGHTSFVYSVDVLSTGEFVSSGEDRTVRVWKDGNNIQTLQQPCISVWSVTVLPNDDIAVGGSDYMVRVFTRDVKRMAIPEAQKNFKDLLASQSITSNQLGDVEKEKLPGAEALQTPGKKDGQIIMINTGPTVEAYQWSNQEWQKIGEVVGGTKKKQTYEGKEYDYVFDIDVGAGSGGNLKLPYDVSQNPYKAAEKFLLNNELPQSFTDQIVDFIIKNTNGESLGGGNKDPFTGAGSYIPGGSMNTPTIGATDYTYVDPFTGGGAYRPGSNNTTAPVNTNSDPFTGSAATVPSPSLQQLKILPIRDYVPLKNANPDAAFKRIQFLNDMSENKLSDETLKSLAADIAFLKNPTASALSGNTGLVSVITVATEWGVDNRLPALDLIRLYALYAPESLVSAVPEGNVITFLIEAGGLSTDNTLNNEKNARLAYNGLANLFNTEYGRQLVWEKRNIFSNVMEYGVAGRFKSKLSRLAINTLAVNLAVLLSSKQEAEYSTIITSSLVGLLMNETDDQNLEQDDENLYRLIVAFGTFIFHSSSCRTMAKTIDARTEIERISKKTKDQRTRNAAREILQLLS